MAFLLCTYEVAFLFVPKLSIHLGKIDIVRQVMSMSCGK